MKQTTLLCRRAGWSDWPVVVWYDNRRELAEHARVLTLRPVLWTRIVDRVVQVPPTRNVRTMAARQGCAAIASTAIQRVHERVWAAPEEVIPKP